MLRVPDNALEEIERLRNDGIELTDHDVVWLASLGQKVENPCGLTAEAAGFSSFVRLSDDTALKALTIKGSAWLDRYGAFFSGAMELYAVAFALTGLIDIEQPVKQVVADVARWAASLRVTHDELERAVASLIESDAPTDTETGPVDFEAVAGNLVAATGLPREYWLDQSWLHVIAVQNGILRQAALLNANMDEDPQKAAGREAVKNMMMAIKDIRSRG